MGSDPEEWQPPFALGAARGKATARMTLGEFLAAVGRHPLIALAYFLGLPLLTYLLGSVLRERAGNAPWKYGYAVLVYAACVPGMLATTLGLYQFLFGARNILEVNLTSEVLPIISTALTLAAIAQHVSFDAIPGFDRLSGLLAMLAGVFVGLYLLDKLHIIALLALPVILVPIVVIGIVLLVRLGLRKLTKSGGAEAGPIRR